MNDHKPLAAGIGRYHVRPMTRLALALTDFTLPEDATKAPQLAAFDRLLSRGRRVTTTAPTWRHWVLAQAGIAAPARLPVARTVAGRAGHWALVTPLHLLAGLEHVHLDPAGPPALSAAESRELARGFNEAFGEDGIDLTFEGNVGLLSLPGPCDATTHDPLPLAGRDALAWLPSGPDGATLRRLMTEAQMWLHVHPMNIARETLGQPLVNALWFWGLGEDEIGLPAGQLPRLDSNDAYLTGVWRTAAAPLAPVPASLDEWLAAPPANGVVTLDLSSLAPGPAAALEAAEQQWFGPIAARLARSSLAQAEIFLGGAMVTLRPGDRLRIWRACRPWHEVLQ